MTQEEKDLLLRDLCGRLPYGLKLKIRRWKTPVELTIIKRSVLSGNYIINENYKLDDIKPYLRPMTSMTEEEIKELGEVTLKGKMQGGLFAMLCPTHAPLDWLNAHHFDYRGLIEKGLAIAVTEDNNPYKD